MSYTYHGKDLEIMQDSKIVLPKNDGFLESKMIVVNQDISLFKISSFVKENLKIEYDELILDSLFLGYALEGEVKFENKSLKESYCHKKREASISFLQNFKGTTHYTKDVNSSGLSIVLNKNFVQKNIPNLLDNKCERYFKHTQTEPRIHALANEIYHSPFAGHLEELYLQSKIFEIIFLQFSNPQELKSEKNVKFSDFDKEAIKKAKQILINRLENPPSISELARLVALNEFKLKLGFKKLFKLAPYQFLLMHKMQEAKKLLEIGDLNINEISQKIGYKHPQSFSSAFCKYFGVSAKSFQKSRKFYM